MPIMNILIVLFVLAMIYMGTVQGLFSSFLHLIVVIAAGTLAYAAWEPLTVMLLLKYTPLFAWTLGLLIPFGLILLILRMTSDKLVPLNAQFNGVVNLVGGIVFGGLSGLLTAGVVAIGLGFLPMGPDLGGYQPYSVGAGGVIQDTGDKLWIPVNRIANNFFGGLSRGSFATSTPLAEYKPDLDIQMSLNRVRPENVSTIAAPDAVEVPAVYIADTAALTETMKPELAEVLGSRLNQPGAKLVIVDTDWSTVKGTVDGDRNLRLPSSQVRLIARPTDPADTDIQLLGPVGFSKPIGDGRTFYLYDSESQMAYSEAPTSTFGFVFIVPGDLEPLFPQVRLLRLDMPEANQKVEDVLAVVGVPAEETPEGTDPDQQANGQQNTGQTTNVGDRTGMRAGSYVLNVENTHKLPTPTSKNTISGISVGDGENGAVIESGSKGAARKPAGSIGSRNKIVGFDIAPNEAMIRVEVTGDQNTSLFGAGMSSAAALNPIFLEDSKGNKWFVTAYVWYKADKTQEIHYDAYVPIKSAKQMPISQMDKEDKFYLYFTVKKPVTLTRYSIGDVSSQEFEPPMQIAR